MIQTILLSAVNGIVHILMQNKNAIAKTKIKDDYTIQGIETIQNALKGERFRMTDISETCRWHGRDAGDCLPVDAVCGTMGLPARPAMHVAAATIDQHSKRRIFSQRVEAGTGTPNEVYANDCGDKSFLNMRLVSGTINLVGEEITSQYSASQLSLYQCRLYKKIDDPVEEAEWNRSTDFFPFSDIQYMF